MAGGKSPLVVLVVGVNGVGKTTTIGKLASRYKEQGKKVQLAAGDTFEQLAVNPPLDESDFNASPAVVGRQIFLRSNKSLYCLEAR